MPGTAPEGTELRAFFSVPSAATVGIHLEESTRGRDRPDLAEELRTFFADTNRFE
jgi:hypothetical protein